MEECVSIVINQHLSENSFKHFSNLEYQQIYCDRKVTNGRVFSKVALPVPENLKFPSNSRLIWNLKCWSRGQCYMFLLNVVLFGYHLTKKLIYTKFISEFIVVSIVFEK